MRRWNVLLLIVAIVAGIGLSVPGSLAQARSETESVVLVYTNLEDTVTLYNAADDSYSTLIPRDLARVYDYQMYLANDGNHIAILVTSFDREAFRRGDNSTQTYELYVFSLPDGEVILQRSLLPEDYIFPPANGAEQGTQSEELSYALEELRWSNNGQHLAWIEGVNNGDAAIFLFDVSDESITELPDQTGYPALLNWSPDDSHVIYATVETFGGGADLSKDAAYVVEMEDYTAEPLELNAETSRYWLLDWVQNDAFLWSPYDADTGAAGVLLYDLEAHTSTEIVSPDLRISIPVWDRSTETLAFAVPDLSYASITTGLNPGAYIIEGLSGEPVQIDDSTNLFGVQFVRPGYLAIGNDLIMRLSDRTEFNMNELRWPHYSPDGTYALGERESRTVIRNLSTEEEINVSGLFFVEGYWLDEAFFIAKVGAYGSVIGYGELNGPFVELVADAGNGPFVGAIH